MIYKLPNPAILQDQILALPDNIAIQVLSLVKFEKRLTLTDGKETTGYNLYQEFVKRYVPILNIFGGKLLYHGDVQASLVAPSEEHWDQILLAQFQTKKHLHGMLLHPEFIEVMTMRMNAVIDSRMHASVAKAP